MWIKPATIALEVKKDIKVNLTSIIVRIMYHLHKKISKWSKMKRVVDVSISNLKEKTLTTDENLRNFDSQLII